MKIKKTNDLKVIYEKIKARISGGGGSTVKGLSDLAKYTFPFEYVYVEELTTNEDVCISLSDYLTVLDNLLKVIVENDTEFVPTYGMNITPLYKKSILAEDYNFTDNSPSTLVAKVDYPRTCIQNIEFYPQDDGRMFYNPLYVENVQVVSEDVEPQTINGEEYIAILQPSM